MRVLTTDTIMGGAEDRKRLAEEVVAFGRGLPRVRRDWQTVTTTTTGGGEA